MFAKVEICVTSSHQNSKYENIRRDTKRIYTYMVLLNAIASDTTADVTHMTINCALLLSKKKLCSSVKALVSGSY